MLLLVINDDDSCGCADADDGDDGHVETQKNVPEGDTKRTSRNAR